MKRLFAVKKGKKVVLYEGSKREAKIARRQHNGVDDEGNELLSSGYRVARGPDHRRGET